MSIENGVPHGIKALRECEDATIADSEIVSEEFGWMSRNVRVRGGSIAGNYAFLHARDLRLKVREDMPCILTPAA